MTLARSTAVVLLVVLTGLTGPPTAAAHLRSGTVAVDYRASVLRPSTPAYSAQIYQSDRGLQLTLKPGHVVVALGYLSEPVFRLDAAGLWINSASPTAVAVGLLKKTQLSSSSTPRWRLQRGQHSAVWHDARAGGLSPGSDRGGWSVPLIVDGRAARLVGELQRFPAPSLWLWLVALACLLGVGGGVHALGRGDLARAGAIAFAALAAGASAVIVVAFALDSYASPGTWILGLDAIAFVAVGIGVLVRGPANLHMVAAIGLGLVGLAVGLLEGPVFFHPIVLAFLPGTVIRLLVIVAIGAGLSAALLGGLFYDETTSPRRDAERVLVHARLGGAPERSRPGS